MYLPPGQGRAMHTDYFVRGYPNSGALCRPADRSGGGGQANLRVLEISDLPQALWWLA